MWCNDRGVMSRYCRGHITNVFSLVILDTFTVLSFDPGRTRAGVVIYTVNACSAIKASVKNKPS